MRDLQVHRWGQVSSSPPWSKEAFKAASQDPLVFYLGILWYTIMENQMEKKMENELEATVVYWGYIGIMEKKMETTIVYWGYSGIMEEKMQTTIYYGY